MPRPLTASNTPLVFDTISALKVQRYYGLPPGRNVYTYGRFYMMQGQLALSLACFERDPAPACRAAFALCGQQGSMVFTVMAPARSHSVLLPEPTAGLTLKEAENHPAQPSGPPPEYFAGEDEQGWYWGANLILPSSLLQSAGIGTRPGTPLRAAVYRYEAGQPGFGASHICPAGASPLDAAQFTAYTITDY